MKKISVLGAGAWGTALAHIAAENGKEVVLWAREPELIDEIKTKRRNTLFLPDVALNKNITPTNDQAAAVLNAEAVSGPPGCPPLSAPKESNKTRALC